MKPITTLFFKDVEAGAQTTLYCAVQEGIESLSGRHFSNCAVQKVEPKAQDDAVAKKLWEVSETLSGLSWIHTGTHIQHCGFNNVNYISFLLQLFPLLICGEKDIQDFFIYCGLSLNFVVHDHPYVYVIVLWLFTSNKILDRPRLHRLNAYFTFKIVPAFGVGSYFTMFNLCLQSMTYLQ